MRCARDGLALDTLSMGMSADLEAAIAEGATLVRVGSAIFGERIPPRSAFGASPPGGRRRERPGRAGSAAAARLSLTERDQRRGAGAWLTRLRLRLRLTALV